MLILSIAIYYLSPATPVQTKSQQLNAILLISCLFVFLALQPIVVVFSQLGSGLQPPRYRGFLITHNDAPQSVGLLWTSDQSVAETSYLTAHNTHNRQTSMLPVGFEPTILATSGRRPTP